MSSDAGSASATSMTGVAIPSLSPRPMSVCKPRSPTRNASENNTRTRVNSAND